MNKFERLGDIVLSREVQRLPMDTKRMFIEMVSLYTGFLSFIPEDERTERADEIQNILRDEHGITLDHPAVKATLVKLNPRSY